METFPTKEQKILLFDREQEPHCLQVLGQTPPPLLSPSMKVKEDFLEEAKSEPVFLEDKCEFAR
jgi:hypothetical protein